MSDALTHIEHFEDLLFFYRKAEILDSLNSMKSVSEKWDGCPSIIIGRTTDGKKFVATKSIFNKTPKINFTKTDIFINHGKSTGLIALLGRLLDMDIDDIEWGNAHQGDVMFANNLFEKDFTPNVVTYNFGQGIARPAENIGIAFHTMYKCGEHGYDLFRVTTTRTPNINGVFTSFASFSFVDSEILNDMSNYAAGILKRVNVNLAVQERREIMTRVNSVIRQNVEFDVDDYLGKTDLMIAHQELMSIKEIIVNNLNKNRVSAITASIGDVKGPEGWVTKDNYGYMTKFVRRRVFSSVNFLKND